MKKSSITFESLNCRILLTGEPTLVVDLAQGRAADFSLDVASIHEDLVFAAEDEHGVGIYSSNPVEGTRLLARSQLRGDFFSFKEALYFWDGESLRVTDGSPEGTRTIRRLTGANGEATEFVSFDNDFYFVVGNRLWESDGTLARRVRGVGEVFPTLGATEEKLYFLEHRNSRLMSLDGDGGETIVHQFPGPVENFVTLGESVVSAAKPDFESSPVASFELWATDAATGSTHQITDFISRGFTLDSESLMTFGDSVYFVATDPEHGTELWASDGTVEGTRIVADIDEGKASSSPMELAQVGDLLYFSAETKAHGRELWKTDGTQHGTELVADINEGIGSSQPVSIVAFSDEVYFVANDSDGRTFWRSDGTDEGTRQVKDLNPGGDDVFVQANSLSGTLISAVPHGLVIRGKNELNQEIIWQSDGSSEGTFAIDTFLATQLSSDFVDIVSTENGVLLPGETGLRFSDGTEVGTVFLDVPWSLPIFGTTDFEYEFAKREDGSYFIGSEDFGSALWKTDGTQDGTLRVSDLGMQGNGTKYKSIVTADEKLIFGLGRTRSDADSGQLWTSDGTEQGTVLLKAGLDLENLNVFGDKVLFQVETTGTLHAGALRYELWITDGTLDGTLPIKNVVAGHPLEGIEYRDRFLFSANGLWLTDGTEQGTQELSSVDYAAGFTQLGDEIFFVGETTEAGVELWKTDGTSQGTQLVWDTLPGPESRNPRILGTQGGHLLVTVEVPDADHRELWVIDGSLHGRRHVVDLRFFGSPEPATHYANQLYFTADDGITGFELWRMDEELGVERVADIYPGTPGSYPSWLTVSGDSLYFAASHPTYGMELWVLNANLEPSLAADFDRDGQVGFSDFLILSSNFGQAATVEEGDANGDGQIDFADFLILSHEFGQGDAS